MLSATKGEFSLGYLFELGVIDPSCNFLFDRISRAASTSRVLSAASTASDPQQIFACLRRLLVDFLSLYLENVGPLSHFSPCSAQMRM
jgi:hypothetical protein